MEPDSLSKSICASCMIVTPFSWEIGRISGRWAPSVLGGITTGRGLLDGMRDGKAERPGRLDQSGIGFDDTASASGGVGIDREREACLEMEISFDAEAEPTPDAFEFGEADIAQFRRTETKIAKAKEDIRLRHPLFRRHHLGDDPGRRAAGIEEFDDWNVIDLAIIRSVGGQTLTEIVGEKLHCCLPSRRHNTGRGVDQGIGAEIQDEISDFAGLT